MTATTGFQRDNEGYFVKKDPQAVLDYTVDYTNFLQTGDSIASQTTTADTGLTVDSSSIIGSSKKITMNLSGGTVNTTYEVKLTAVTANSLTFVHRFKVKCEEVYLT